MGRRASVLLGVVALGAVLVAPASSGEGIKMRTVPKVCTPSCIGDLMPVWSPDGKTIAFIRRTRTVFPRAIFAVPAAGGRAWQVIPPDRSFVPDSIAWSPDSTRLAFHAMEGGNYVVPARGGDPVKVAPASNELFSFDYPARWSRDGSRLAIERQGPFNRYGPPPWCCQVWLVAPDGSSSMLLGGGPPPGEWLAQPAWSPDGRIAYVTGPRTSFGSADFARAEIWVSNADGSERRRLVAATPDQRTISRLEWSADGSRLAYVVELNSGWLPRWVRSDGALDGGFGLIERQRDLSTYCCSFRADAASVAYTIRGADGAMEVHVQTEFRSGRRIADGISSQSRFRLTSASWSPDGERLTYVSDGECPTELAVHTVRADGKDVRRVTRSCRIAGTHGPNRLRGTSRTDALYGLGGNDRLVASGRPDFLQGGFGRDVLFGGSGDDRLYGGPGLDRLYAGPGWDAVYSRDGTADVVRCGTGKDAVRADSRDRIARDCELVERE